MKSTTTYLGRTKEFSILLDDFESSSSNPIFYLVYSDKIVSKVSLTGLKSVDLDLIDYVPNVYFDKVGNVK